MASGHVPRIGFGHGILNATASLPSRDASKLSHGWTASALTGTWTFTGPHDGPPACTQRRYQRAVSSSTAGAKLKLWTPPSEPGQCPGFASRRELLALIYRAPDLAADGYVKARTRYLKADGSVGWTSGDFLAPTGPVGDWTLATGELVHSGGNGISTQVELEIYGGAAAAVRTFDVAFVDVALWTYAASLATLEAPLVQGTSCRPVDSGRSGGGHAWGRPSTPPPGRRRPLSLELSWGGVSDDTKQAIERAYAGSVEAGYQPGGWDGMGNWGGIAGPGGAGLPLLVLPDLESFPLAGLYDFDGPPSVSLAGSEMADPPIWNVAARLLEVL